MDLIAPFRTIANRSRREPKVTTQRDALAGFFAMVRPVPITQPLIRIGAAGDGGYLVPDDLDGISACFSPGVATTATFEEDLASRGIKSFLADYSVKQPPVDNPLFDFERKYLGSKNDRKYIRLEDWVRTKHPDPGGGDLLLQMDIEGGEFAVLDNTPEHCLRQFRIIVVEFHFMSRLYRGRQFSKLEPSFRKLAAIFDVVHIHPNNCCPIVSAAGYEIPEVIEFTFFRKDRVKRADRELAYPHPLDSQNVPHRDNIILPRCWWTSIETAAEA